MAQFTNEDLRILQALPLDLKIRKTQNRIEDWYMQFGGEVYVSFSGGKDSTVLLHLVRSMFPEVPAVFCDTGLEYPELRRFAKGQKNVRTIRPKMTFDQVITKYGYPLVSKEVAEAIYYARRITPKDLRGGSDYTKEEKRATWTPCRGIGTPIHRRGNLLGLWQREDETGVTLSSFNKTKWLPLAEKAPFRVSHYCCNVMKKLPFSAFHTETGRTPYLGTMAEESRVRKQAWLRHGCNAFHAAKQTSQPMSFWTEQDVLEYIERYHLDIAPVYGDIVWTDKNGQITIPDAKGAKRSTTGCDRTGCVFCGFGMHLDKGESRFQRMKCTHPRLYEYSIEGGQWIDNPDYIEGLSSEPDEMGWIPWNPERIWVPDKKGLGMGYVFDTCNEIYGKEMWRYK